MEEFIFMVNFDEIEFLDCEIIDDDPDAPIGTLVRVNADGTVEEVAPIAPQEAIADVQEIAQQEVAEEPIVSEPIEQEAEEPVIEQAIEDKEDIEESSNAHEIAPEEPQAEQINEVAIQEQAPVDEPIAQEPAKEVAKPAPKKKSAPKKHSVKSVESQDSEQAPQHKGLNLQGGESVNDALFSTSFEIQQPAKTKVVSTKKKQEKQEDLWAVAAIKKPKKEAVAQPKEEPAPKKTAKKAEVAPEGEQPVQKRKPATKKTTNVENITNDTEENEVAKATDKTVAPQEEKAVKATKAAKPENNDETILVEGEGKIHGKFVIKKTDKGNFVFKLYSSNHRVVAIGAQAYTTLGAAKIGVQSVIKNAENAPVENQTLKNVEVQKFPKWEIYTDKKGEFRLRLFATNGSLIATTNDGYADISGAKNGIAAVARACKGCAIARNDNLW